MELPEVGGLHHRYERHRHCVLFDRSLTLHLAVACRKKIWQANQPIRRSVKKIASADFILETEPKRTSSGKNLTTATFWRTTITAKTSNVILSPKGRCTAAPQRSIDARETSSSEAGPRLSRSSQYGGFDPGGGPAVLTRRARFPDWSEYFISAVTCLTE